MLDYLLNKFDDFGWYLSKRWRNFRWELRWWLTLR